jgi:hypothetical protein
VKLDTWKERKILAEDRVLIAAKDWYRNATGPTDISAMGKANRELLKSVKELYDIIDKYELKGEE